MSIVIIVWHILLLGKKKKRFTLYYSNCITSSWWKAEACVMWGDFPTQLLCEQKSHLIILPWARTPSAIKGIYTILHELVTATTKHSIYWLRFCFVLYQLGLLSFLCLLPSVLIRDRERKTIQKLCVSSFFYRTEERKAIQCAPMVHGIYGLKTV